jgi:catechol 2,3-dioxygenase-like lactoylglutathione lyase family enzyme
LGWFYASGNLRLPLQLAPSGGHEYDAIFVSPIVGEWKNLVRKDMPDKKKTQGLRHLALRVRNVQNSQRFYERLFDMTVVWHPDPENVYLSTGYDNLALHQLSSEELSQFNLSRVHPLDHLVFLMDSPESVNALFTEATEQGITIVKPLKQHRDGSYSFYLHDPDQNTIQVIFEPTVHLP